MSARRLTNLKPVTSKRDKYLMSKYGINEAIYRDMLAAGNGACWICQRKPKPGKNLNVDHEHPRKNQTGGGQVRGLLDFFCNKYLIGRRRKEHAGLFERAAAYLRSERDWRIDVSVNTGTSAHRSSPPLQHAARPTGTRRTKKTGISRRTCRATTTRRTR